jgi:hypothetical protein
MGWDGPLVIWWWWYRGLWLCRSHPFASEMEKKKKNRIQRMDST